MYAVPKPPFAILFFVLFGLPVFAYELAENPAQKAVGSSINSSFTMGSDKYSDGSLSATVGIGARWGLELFSSTTRLNGNVVARDIGLSPIWQINPNHELKLDLAVGGQDGGVNSRSSGISYSVNAGSVFSDSGLRSDVTLQLASTVYTIDTVQISPKESRGSLSLSQELSEKWSVGFSLISASYTDQAIQSFRRYADREGISEFLAAYEAGPLERATSIFGEYQLNSKYTFKMEVVYYAPVAGAAKSSTTSLSSQHAWNENWNTGAKISATKTAGTSKGSVGLSIGYLF